MTYRRILFIAALAAGSCLALAGCVQEKDSDNDGDEEIVISQECSWYGGVTCEAECDDFDFWFSCESQFEAECAPECEEFEIDVNCSTSCEASCATECTDPGSFDCQAHCEGECGVNCEADCEASITDSEAQAECKAHCSAYCEGDCSASCDIDLPDCETACSASCEGECTADANIDCHLCDVDVYASCEGEMNLDCEGGCDADGALECEGEFISSDDLEEAIAWVEANTDFEVTYDASAECSGNSCEAEASATLECDVAAPGRESSTGLVAVIASSF
jgi:hypothetical protein